MADAADIAADARTKVDAKAKADADTTTRSTRKRADAADTATNIE